MLTDYRMKKLQDRILEHGNYENEINAAIEELLELRDELRLFLFRHTGSPLTAHDLRRPAGNLQKEIEDVSNILIKLRKMFIQTADQRLVSRRSRRIIVSQLKEHLSRFSGNKK